MVVSNSGATEVDHYNLYRGTIDSLQNGAYDHITRANSEPCDGDNSDLVLEDSSLGDGNNYYYLAVGNNGLCAGHYGDDSNDTLRPDSDTLGGIPCQAQCN